MFRCPLKRVNSRLTRRTNPNGGITNAAYDTFGRLTSVQGPTSGTVRKRVQSGYGLPTLSASGRWSTVVSAQTDAPGSSATGPSSWTVYDGLGQVIQTQVQDASGVVVVINSYRDGRGLVWRTSVPHRVASSGGSFLEADYAAYGGGFSETSFDALRRPTLVVGPDGQSTLQFYDGWARERSDALRHLRRTEADGLGRTLRVKEYTGTYGTGPNPNAPAYAITQFASNVLDQLTQVTDAAGNVTQLGYDGLGRKTSLSDPDMGAWQYAYDAVGTLQSQTDALGQRTDFVYDALGRLQRTWYPVAWTTPNPPEPSVYDLVELRCAVDANRVGAGLSAATWTDAALVAGTGVPVRAVHFTELRGRLQELWTPAGMGSIPGFTRGAITAGTRVISGQDLADLRGWLGQYEQSAWGAARRAREVRGYDWYDGSTVWGRGRLCDLWDTRGRTYQLWDAAGRVTQETLVLDGHAYTTIQTYDGLDRLSTQTLPDGEVLTTSYGADGRLSALRSSLGTTLVDTVRYTALGQPGQYHLGGDASSGVVAQTFYGLDGQSTSGGVFGALRSVRWPNAAPTLLNRTLGYFPAGTLASVADGANGETSTYLFDELDRLTDVGGPLGNHFAYSLTGNLISKGGQALTYPAQGGPAGSRPHAVTEHNATTYRYDANGSLVSRGVQNITYDPRRLPLRLEQGGSTVWRAAYDGDGVRRKRLDASGTIHYVSGSYEVNLGNGQTTAPTITKYYAALGRLLAFRTNGVLRWVGTDHLGSTARVTDASFVALDQLRYAPFGSPRDAATNLGTDHRFTGQIVDQSTMLNGNPLYWYGSRAYDPALGRFLCPDSIVPSPGDPQSLNRYSYVRNNPVGRVDPSGHWDLTSREGLRAFYDNNPGTNRGLSFAEWSGFAQRADSLFSGVDSVMFVGGWHTNDQADASEWNAYTGVLDGLHKGYNFFDWHEGWSGEGDPTVVRGLPEAAGQLGKKILAAGHGRKGLVGHSRGGALVAEFVAELAEGGLKNTGVVAAASLSGTLDGPQAAGVGFQRGRWGTYGQSARDRLGNLHNKLPGVAFVALENDADMVSNRGPGIAGGPDYAEFRYGGLTMVGGQLLTPFNIHGAPQRDPLAVDFVGMIMG